MSLTKKISLPRHCVYCAATAGDGGLCDACHAALPWNTPCCPHCALPQSHDALCADCAAQAPPYDAAWSPLRLETPVQDAIHGLKYRAQFLSAYTLGQLMARQLARRKQPLPQVLIPVPLHPSRLRWRGYNQALEIARLITQQVHIRLLINGAKRVRATEDQIGKSASARQKNVRGAFRINTPLEGQHIALLDDVMTTGATLSELARLCRKAGARKIEVWAAARVA